MAKFEKGAIPWNKGRGKIVVCPICQNTRWYENNEIKRGRRFCSRECGYKGRKLKGCFVAGHPDLVPKEKRGHTELTKQKISLSQVGKKRKKFFEYLTPISRRERLLFRSSLQKKILKRDNYTCQICGVRGGWLQVDHIQPWKSYPELRFDLDNCRTLCMSCHYFVTFGKEKPENLIWGHNLCKVEGRIG